MHHDFGLLTLEYCPAEARAIFTYSLQAAGPALQLLNGSLCIKPPAIAFGGQCVGAIQLGDVIIQSLPGTAVGERSRTSTLWCASWCGAGDGRPRLLLFPSRLHVHEAWRMCVW